MQILLLHVDFIEYEAKKKAIRNAEKVKENNRKARAENALTVFTAVEKADEGKEERVAERAKEEISKVCDTLKVENIVIYPYAHLSSSLSKPDTALEVMKLLEEKLSRSYNVKRAPFGWYKAFSLSCKGHALAELSRRIVVEDEHEEVKAGEKKEIISQALKAEEKLKSKRFILTPELELIPASKFDFSKYESLEILYEYETKGSRISEKEPKHIKLMKEMELVDNEIASDSGNLRWYPKGKLIKKLLETQVSKMLIDYGAMEVETPIMYDLQHPNLSAYLHRFPARQYIVKSDDKEYFLRFAACFGQYLMSKDMVISYKHLPIKLYELTHYSFRREQSGEVSGLKRLRTFTMPDMHTLCRDLEQAKQEFSAQFKLCMSWFNHIELDYDLIIRCVRSFYEENKDFVHTLVKLANKPALVEIWDERFFYFIMKVEFSINDSLNKASTLSTVQIDVENAERFNIKYFDENGKEAYPLLLHASISGSIDRNLYAILEAQAMRAEKGEKPMLPLWLSPTQVRIIPVADAFLDYCRELLEKIKKNNIRADLDDREITMQKKIREAEKEWIPYIIVIGEREIKSNKLAVRVRERGRTEELTLEHLVSEIREKTKSKAFAELPLPELLSRRPIFRG